MFFNERRRLVDLAAKNRLPAVYQWREFVDAGGLMSYGPNGPDLFRRAATYVVKILKGARPAAVPTADQARCCEQPRASAERNARRFIQ
jgi:putative ABC transport system substrate-binding protein